MAANSVINLTSLDFDTLKNNFKTYLKNQSVFQDYDFDGSNINVLLDIMTYNTYLNSFYLNMAVSEGFLDSAQLRSSVISHAKELNYTPRSARSPKALIDVSFDTTGLTGTIFEIPKGAQFSGTNANGTFVFTTDKATTLTSTTSTFTHSALPIYEGTYVNETFVVDSTINNQRFVISNENVDTTSINISTSIDNGQTTTDLIQATTLYGLNSNSAVYFIQATQDGYYEIVFGDGVFGKQLINGTAILVTYRITKGDAANGISSFNIDVDLGTFNGCVAITTITPNTHSTDGAQEEDIESIRFRAPRHFQTQDRAITTTDYANLIYDNFPVVRAVNVYGGETVSGSVEFGKVFISPLSQSGGSITNDVKNDITTYLHTKNALGISTVIVDPTTLYVVPTITVAVNFNQTQLSPADISAKIITTLNNYNTNYLENFNTTFRYSNFISALNNADQSISSVQVATNVAKYITPELNKTTSLSLTFNNQIAPGTILSSEFIASDGNVYRFTDYNPNVNTFKRVGEITNYQVENTSNALYLEQVLAGTQSYSTIGTVNYDSGQIDITSIAIVDFLGTSGIVFETTTVEDNVYGIKNDVIELDIANATVNVVSV